MRRERERGGRGRGRVKEREGEQKFASPFQIPGSATAWCVSAHGC